VTSGGARRITIAAAFLFLASIYIFSEWRDLQRAPHVDEVEHLHSAILIARGERPFIDFQEHHPPLFWGMLQPFITATEGTEEMHAFVNRARVFSWAITGLAVVATAFIVWRASANAWTVVTFIGFLFVSGGVWWNGMGDVRPDSAALGIWWLGAALVLLARRPSLRGAGLGLAFIASLIKPQWPISSVVLGVVFLIDVLRERRAFFIASTTAVLTSLVGIGATALLANPRVVYFHVVTMTAQMIKEAGPAAKAFFPPLFGCPPLMRPLTIYLAVALVVLALWRARSTFGAPRLVITLLVLSTASLAEIYFVYPYPAVDFRFYSFWCVIAAAILALLPQSAVALLPASAHRLRKAIPAIAVAMALLLSIEIIPAPRMQPQTYWRYAAWLEKRMQPGETIWNGIGRHPIDAHDANYYWFGMLEVVPVAMKMAQTDHGRPFLPPITERDLPPCRIERGLDRNVRFIASPLYTLPIAYGCFARLRDSGRLQSTSYEKLWMVGRS
jgi:hypothetical protein